MLREFLHLLLFIILYNIFFSEFNTIVDIELHKWAESLQLATSCADVGMITMFNQLHDKLVGLEVSNGGSLAATKLL